MLRAQSNYFNITACVITHKCLILEIHARTHYTHAAGIFIHWGLGMSERSERMNKDRRIKDRTSERSERIEK
jgi:hypothetical protein